MVSDLGALVDRVRPRLLLLGALSVRGGWELRDGWLTGRRAVIVTLPSPVAAETRRMPEEIAGIPVDVRPASPRKVRALTVYDPSRPWDAAPDQGGLAALSLTGGRRRAEADLDAAPVRARARRPTLPYTPPPGIALAPVTGTVTVRLSASPDAGWPMLRDFLQATQARLTVGLYDFTSAHVLAAVKAAMTGKSFQLVLDDPALNPTADQNDDATVAALHAALGSGFSQAWALEAGDPHATAAIYPSAYHIKVAVRDGVSVWLSSGNWNNSNQPDIVPAASAADALQAQLSDRDWHVVIDHEGLAATFEAYLDRDYTVAAAHNTVSAAARTPLGVAPLVATPPFAEFFDPVVVTEPMTITPLLTPDPGVYPAAVLDLIRSAQASLELQYQYIDLPRQDSGATKPFADLIDAVIARQRAGVAVRVIMSQYETADYLEMLQTAGLDVVHSVRLQNNVHNKGIIVDQQRVLISSQNWSTAGVLQNRDAGVIIDNATVASYYRRIFDHDWDHLAAAQAQPT